MEKLNLKAFEVKKMALDTLNKIKGGASIIDDEGCTPTGWPPIPPNPWPQ